MPKETPFLDLYEFICEFPATDDELFVGWLDCVADEGDECDIPGNVQEATAAMRQKADHARLCRRLLCARSKAEQEAIRHEFNAG